jgi:hypothetical protein
LLSDESWVTAIDVDSGREKLYWSDLSPEGGRILRADIINDSLLTNRETIVSGLGRALGIYLDVESGKLYWVDDMRDRIERANLDGSGVETIAETNVHRPSSVVVDRVHGRVYWVDGSHLGKTVVDSANPDGSGREIAFAFPGEYFYLDIQLDNPVGITPKAWGQIKRKYRE